jgi:choline dehydrogenase-like flavoprotein
VVTPSELTLRGLLRLVGAGLLFAAVVYLAGGFIGGFFRELPFVANSVVKVTVLGLACLYAAGNVRGRRGVVVIVLAAHLVSVLAMLVLLVFADTGNTVDLWIGDATITGVLWGAIVLDGVITLGIGAVFALALRDPSEPIPSPPEPKPLTSAEKRLRVLLIVFAALCLVAGLAYEAGPLIESTDQFFAELPFVTNSVVRVAAVGLLAVYAAANIRRNMPLVTPIVAGELLAAAVQLVYAIPADGEQTIFDEQVATQTILLVGAAVDALIGVGLLVANELAWRARYELKYLWPGSFRALSSMADVLVVSEDRVIPATNVAHNVESYVSNVLVARRRWIYRLALYGMQLGSLACRGVPLSELEPGDRRAFLERHFRKLPRWPPFAKNLLRAGIRVGQQLSFAGYYNDSRTDESVGYTRYAPGPDVELPGKHDLTVEEPDSDVLETEVCIVGSGAGGAIAAYELAMAGHDVLVLERGRYVEPRHFTDNEVEMIGKLYADGVMQQTEDFNFTVLQGSCVGGSTTVNNAVCFPPPDKVLKTWNDENLHDAGLDIAGLKASVAAIETFLPVISQGGVEKLNPSAPRYVEGAAIAGYSPTELEVAPVNANITDCAGCGYCNIGCKYGHKMSMLDKALPEGQRESGGRLRIVADCEVERIRTVSGRPQHVAGLLAKLRDGRRVRIEARRYILAAGAVGSSYILLKSHAASDLPVGRKLCFNMGAPITAEFEERQDAQKGLQISHYGIPRDNGFVFETWFNPPVAQALNMPGWFEQHYQNMRRYPWLGAVGVLVGTQGNARVKQGLTGGPGIEYTPAKRDLLTLARGLRMLGEILFAGGAKRLMLNSWGYEEFTSRGQLEWIDRIALEPQYLALGTGHPQGGNAMSRDPSKGVVGPDFRVHGYDNLYVTDASVIPSSLTVNPQLTVMGLAHHAAQQMKATWS